MLIKFLKIKLLFQVFIRLTPFLTFIYIIYIKKFILFFFIYKDKIKYGEGERLFFYLLA